MPNAGLLTPALLVQRLGVAELVDEHVGVAGPGAANAGAKAMTVVGSALAGGDPIEACQVLGSGAAAEVFDDTPTASTVAVWLRGFAWAAVRTLDRVTRVLLARAWASGLGPGPRRGPDGRRRLDGV